MMPSTGSGLKTLASKNNMAQKSVGVLTDLHWFPLLFYDSVCLLEYTMHPWNSYLNP